MREAVKEVGGKEPPDGGRRAWAVMIAAFLCNGIIFSIINTYSVIYVHLQKELETAQVVGASSKAGKWGSSSSKCQELLNILSTSYSQMG